MSAVPCENCAKPRNVETAVCPHCGRRASDAPRTLGEARLSAQELQAVLEDEQRHHDRTRPAGPLTRAQQRNRAALWVVKMVSLDIAFGLLLRIVALGAIAATVIAIATGTLVVAVVRWRNRSYRQPRPLAIAALSSPAVQLPSLMAGDAVPPRRPRRVPDSTQPPQIQVARPPATRPVTAEDTTVETSSSGPRFLN